MYRSFSFPRITSLVPHSSMAFIFSSVVFPVKSRFRTMRQASLCMVGETAPIGRRSCLKSMSASVLLAFLYPSLNAKAAMYSADTKSDFSTSGDPKKVET